MKTPFFTAYADSSIQECYVSALVGETLSSGILDCGCTRTVCGSSWQAEFVANLSRNDRATLSEKASSVPFKFGASDVIHSTKCVQLPVYVGDTRCVLEAEVVDLDLPLLISKEAMKSAGMVLHFDRDMALLNGKEIALDTTSSGHYSLPLTRRRNQLVAWNNAAPAQRVHAGFATFQMGPDKTEPERKRMALKLHQQFGHPPHKKLAALVKSAGCEDARFVELLKDVALKCETCTKYGRPSPRPIVGMSLSREFNETIAMDLKQIAGRLILHMIDLTTRYSMAVVVPNKRKDTIIEAILKEWVTKFGVPKKILSDNGGEFNNREMHDIAETLNTVVLTTAAESPWSNGVCERHNAVIGRMVSKIMIKSKCSLESAVAWAINAKNPLHNVYGFSPCQLVLGSNPRLPLTLTDKLWRVELEGRTQSC